MGTLQLARAVPNTNPVQERPDDDVHDAEYRNRGLAAYPAIGRRQLPDDDLDDCVDALETDWLAGAAGFEPLHLEIRSAELHPASTGFRRRSGAPLIRDAQVRVPPPLANSDSNMQRFESRRPSQPVRSLWAVSELQK
jgi:hypothetical protein